MRTVPNQLPEFVKELISDPFKFKEHKPPFSIQQLEELKRIFVKLEANKPNFILLNKEFEDTLIIGDIHGDLNSVVKIVKHFKEEKARSLVFLGDYVDRGENSLLVLVYLLSLAIAWPDSVQLLKGNHEDWKVNKRYGFQKEISELYPKFEDQEAIQTILEDIYDYISLCAMTPAYSFCCHGGIPSGLKDLQDFNKIPKPHSNIYDIIDVDERIYLESIYKQINWNDPVEYQKDDFDFSYRGLDIFTFNEIAVEKFLKLTNCKRIIRAHESSRGGFQSIFDGKVLHIFSAEPYSGKIKKANIVHETATTTTIRKLNFGKFKEI